MTARGLARVLCLLLVLAGLLGLTFQVCRVIDSTDGGAVGVFWLCLGVACGCACAAVAFAVGWALVDGSDAPGRL